MPGYEYKEGYADGFVAGRQSMQRDIDWVPEVERRRRRSPARRKAPKKARKLTAWNRYVKNKKNHIKMRDGKLNLKKMAVQFRKKKR